MAQRPKKASVSDGLPKGQRRGAQAKSKLAVAFRSVFSGNGSADQAQVVLEHLARKTGFFHVTSPTAAADVRVYSEGRRSAYLIIQQFLDMSDTELAELQERVRHESAVTMTEGDFE